jgi:hypothetical protein
MPTHNSDIEKTSCRLGHPVQYLNTMSHEQNLSTTSGAPEFVAQYFLEIQASDNRYTVYMILTGGAVSLYFYRKLRFFYEIPLWAKRTNIIYWYITAV